MPVDLNNLTDGWLELESDPGLFTLLLENMGVNGVQVEEIYDLQKSFEGKVFGFIFLFKWIEERRSRRKIVEDYNNYVRDENIVNNMFFAQQMVPNSCATHSLVSVLLNCSNLDLGPTLSRLRAHTLGMNPENKGWAIGNTPELANAHNSHAAPQARRRFDKAPGVPTSSRVSGIETFHFVSYVTISGRLYELDGLKPHPIDHGPVLKGEEWTEQFRRVITERLGIATGGEPYHDIRFNLMAVVPDKITAYRDKLQLLHKNRESIIEALHVFIKTKYPEFCGKLNCPEDSETEITDSTDGSCNLSLLAVAAAQKWETLEGDTTCQKESSENHDAVQSKVEEGSEENVDSQLQNCTSLSDYATPLTIETSLALPATPSTDTASEAGSAFNSPQICSGSSCQSSPALTTSQRLVVVRMASQQMASSTISASTSQNDIVNNKANNIKTDIEMTENLPHESTSSRTVMDTSQFLNKLSNKLNIVYSLENGSFAPNDLLQLVKILGTEIDLCQNSLKDELEKRKRYKIDDCRRTHNYDQFLVTFLAMLTEQGKLGDLIHQQLQPPRKRLQSASKVQKTNIKRSEAKVSPSANENKKRGRRKKSKAKRRR